MRVCSKCKVPKDESEFWKRPSRGPSALMCRCIACSKSDHDRYKAENLAKFLNADRVSQLERYRANPEPTKARSREAHRQDPSIGRNSKLLRKYGLTPAAWDTLLLSQGGVCAICKQTGKFCVDHDHFSNRVRGILCSQCNVALGMLKDSPELALEAAKYLTRHKV